MENIFQINPKCKENVHQVIGLYTNKYTDKDVRIDDESNFIYFDNIFTSHHIIIQQNNNMKEIKFYISKGECYSGYTTAIWAHYEIYDIISNEKCAKINKITHIPITKIEINLDTFIENITNNEFEYKSNFIHFSKINNDFYYPNGFYNIHYINNIIDIDQLKKVFIQNIFNELVQKINNPIRLKNLAHICNNDLKILGKKILLEEEYDIYSFNNELYDGMVKIIQEYDLLENY